MELQLTAEQNEWREEVRDFLDTELPAQWEKSTEWCEDEDFWAFAIAFTRKVSARGWIGLDEAEPSRVMCRPAAGRPAADRRGAAERPGRAAGGGLRPGQPRRPG